MSDALVFLSPEALAALEALIDERVERRIAEAGPASELASPWLTIPEAAELLRSKRQRIDDLLSAGRLTRHKDGRRTLISRAEIEEYVDRCGR